MQGSITIDHFIMLFNVTKSSLFYCHHIELVTEKPDLNHQSFVIHWARCMAPGTWKKPSFRIAPKKDNRLF